MPGMVLEARDVAKNQIEHLLLSWGDIPSTKGTNRIISDGTKFWLDQKIQSPWDRKKFGVDQLENQSGRGMASMGVACGR